MAEPWVAPDTSAEPPRALGEATAPRPARAAAARARVEGVPVPVTLRPLTGLDIVDGALRLVQQSPATVVALAAPWVLAAGALYAALTGQAPGDVGLTSSLGSDAFGTDGAQADGGVLATAFVLQGVALALVAAGVAQLLAARYVGADPSASSLLRAVARRSPAIVVAWVLVHLVEAVFALALVVPAVVPATWFLVVTPALACERLGPIAALRRSFRLVRGRFGDVLGTLVLVAVVDAMLSLALGAVGTIWDQLGLPAAWAVVSATELGAQLVTVPFVAAATTLRYLDLRVRREGLDLELAVPRRFAGHG